MLGVESRTLQTGRLSPSELPLWFHTSKLMAGQATLWCSNPILKTSNDHTLPFRLLPLECETPTRKAGAGLGIVRYSGSGERSMEGLHVGFSGKGDVKTTYRQASFVRALMAQNVYSYKLHVFCKL